MKKKLFLILAFSLATVSFAQNIGYSILPVGDSSKVINLKVDNLASSVGMDINQRKQYLEPFWKADTIYDETIQPIMADTGLPEANLLFKAKKIISVKDAYLKNEFKEGSDWINDSGKIFLPSGSSAPFFNKSDLVFNQIKQDSSLAGKVPGTYVLYKEGFFQSKQLAVTYIPEENKAWGGPVPAFADKALVKTISKLINKKTLKVVYYGDSITKGANVSGFQGVSPFMPTWVELITYNLGTQYQSPVKGVNLAVGGTTSQWGIENVSQVVAQKPDLIIIGFGMNDGGTAVVPPVQYKKNIKAIIDSIRKGNSDAEFILISTMLANPNSIVSQIQESYKPILDSLARNGIGIVVANITGVHKELLKVKSYQDMTGNNINHPNDYLARWYAQFISGFLIPYETTSVKREYNLIPEKLSLSQNYPNPFNPSTEIKYNISQTSMVTLKVYDLLGRKVATLVNREQKAGNYTVNFDASKLASGIYIYRIQAGDFSVTKKMTLLK
jgi:lysophospholipase L1-like esterase